MVVAARLSESWHWHLVELRSSWGHSLKLVASATVRTAGIGAPGRDLCWEARDGGHTVVVVALASGGACGDGGHTVVVEALASRGLCHGQQAVDGGHTVVVLALASGGLSVGLQADGATLVEGWQAMAATLW